MSKKGAYEIMNTKKIQAFSWSKQGQFANNPFENCDII